MSSTTIGRFSFGLAGESASGSSAGRLAMSALTRAIFGPP
jgi:hypothetical protein